jgi:type IV secretory pathway VirB4 component
MAKISTQKYLDIAEIKDNTIIMKDGTLRAIILCSSINFALKSEDEQNALIQGYMEFLNSLEHPLQIVVQSRRLDIEEYINRLKEAEKKQTNELLRAQITGYLGFINELIEIGEIMTKKFFIVVPYNPFGAKGKSFWARLKEAFSPGAQVKLKREKFLGYKQELDLRVANIQSALNSMGLESAVLDTQGLIELFYNIYNPKTSQNEKLRDISQLGVEIS